MNANVAVPIQELILFHMIFNHANVAVFHLLIIYGNPKYLSDHICYCFT